MTQLYVIKPLRWSGKITFAADGYPDNMIDCENAPFTISGNLAGYDVEAEKYTRPELAEKYCLEWCLTEYHDEWMEHYPTLKAAKQRAWEYWLEYLEPKLIKIGEES